MAEDISFFDWECFYHVEDFNYCLRTTWLIFLAIYLTNAIIFSLLAFLIWHLRKKKRREYEARAARTKEFYDQMP